MSQEPTEVALSLSNSWFEYHATQRTEVFKTYFFVSAGLVSIASFAFQYKFLPAISVIGGMFIISSFVFWLLDNRSRALVEIGEKSYVHYWKAIGLDETLCPAAAAVEQGGWQLRYKHAYLLSFLAGGLFGCFLVGYGVTTL